MKQTASKGLKEVLWERWGWCWWPNCRSLGSHCERTLSDKSCEPLVPQGTPSQREVLACAHLSLLPLKDTHQPCQCRKQVAIEELCGHKHCKLGCSTWTKFRKQLWSLPSITTSPPAGQGKACVCLPNWGAGNHSLLLRRRACSLNVVGD